MIRKRNWRIQSTVVLFLIITAFSCHKDDKIITNDSVRGSWFGSFDCNGLTGGVSDKRCSNIKITFSTGRIYQVELESPCCRNNFILVNEGTYTINNGILNLDNSNCLDTDPDCQISAALSGNDIRFYENGLQINSTEGWYFYEKY